MATPTNVPISSKRAVIEVGTAADAAGTYSTGDVRKWMKNIEMSYAPAMSDETALDADVGQQHKDIPDVTMTFTFKVTDESEPILNTWIGQDSSREFPLRVSPRGTTTGNAFEAGTGLFHAASRSLTPKAAQQRSMSFHFNSYSTGTHS